MMIEMKERMTCLNSILADREAPLPWSIASGGK